MIYVIIFIIYILYNNIIILYCYLQYLFDVNISIEIETNILKRYFEMLFQLLIDNNMNKFKILKKK